MKDSSVCWIDKEKVKDKTYFWMSVLWKTKTKNEESTRLTYTGFLDELEHLKIKTNKDEVNRREVFVCDLDVKVSFSMSL
jgi:hypothetical protein